MATTYSTSTLFLREVSEKKLRRLVKIAHNDPRPLMHAVEDGFFNIIKQKAKDILKIERGRAKTNNIRQYLQRAINVLDNQI